MHGVTLFVLFHCMFPLSADNCGNLGLAGEVETDVL